MTGVQTCALPISALIYDGISDLWVVTKTVRTVKEMEREAKAVDVDYKEID